MIPQVPELHDYAFMQPAHSYLARMSQSLNDVVRIGALTLKETTPQTMRAFQLPPLLLLRQSLQSGDALVILIKSGAGYACSPLLRALMESMLSAMYMLEDDSEQRALAYLYADADRELHLLRTQVDGTAERRRWLGILDKDRTLSEEMLTKLPPGEAATRIASVEKYLTGDLMSPVRAEWTRTKEARKRNPRWYSLFDGPSTFELLAHHLGEHARYELIYRALSSETHAENARRGVRILDDRCVLYPIRYPTPVPEAYVGAVEMLLSHIRRHAEMVGTQYDLTQVRYHYVAHIREEFRRLQKVTICDPSEAG